MKIALNIVHCCQHYCSAQLTTGWFKLKNPGQYWSMWVAQQCSMLFNLTARLVPAKLVQDHIPAVYLVFWWALSFCKWRHTACSIILGGKSETFTWMKTRLQNKTVVLTTGNAAVWAFKRVIIIIYEGGYQTVKRIIFATNKADFL